MKLLECLEREEKLGVYVVGRKVATPRGIEYVSIEDIKIGDKVLIDNHFVLIEN